VNQTCVKLANYIDNTRCPSNHVTHECSGHGDCSNVNYCQCNDGWEGADCSIKGHEPSTTERPATTFQPQGTNQTMSPVGDKTKLTTKQATEDVSNTIVLVFGMVSVVGGVFILFAMMALCYRRSSTNIKFDTPTQYPPFNPKTFKLPQPPPPSSQLPPPQRPHEEIDNRILSLTQLPTYR
jgi:hypothetical protein